jgi:hypothetical protein
VISCVDVPAHTANLLLRLAPHRKVLREGARAFNRRLVDALRRVEGIVGAAGREVAAERPGFAGREDVPGFDNVEFDQRIAGPTVEGEVAGAFGVVFARVLDSSGDTALACSSSFVEAIVAKSTVIKTKSLWNGKYWDVTYFRPERHPVPATIPPPDLPFQVQEYLPPPCWLQLNWP